jgi:hypothetical protein
LDDLISATTALSSGERFSRKEAMSGLEKNLQTSRALGTDGGEGEINKRLKRIIIDGKSGKERAHYCSFY